MANKSYKVNIYLGKDLYEQIESISKFFGCSVPQACKILLNTGMEFSKAIDMQLLNTLNNNNGGK